MKKEASFRIMGGKKLSGEITVQGSKNASLPLIIATLLTEERCCLINVPDIEDIRKTLFILEKMGSKIEKAGDKLYIENKNIDPNKLPIDESQKIRASVLLLGPLLARFSKIELPYPGGDRIGKRPIDTHLDAFSDIGCEVERKEKSFIIKCVDTCDLPSEIILNDFSVTATENVLMFASYHNKKVKITTAAQEPSVQNLCEMLSLMGADIEVFPYHEIKVHGKDKLKGATISVRPDYIEGGTFVAMVLATGGEVTINNFPLSDLKLLIHILKHKGANITENSKDSITVKTSISLQPLNIQTMIFPGFPTDLQSPYGMLSTQLSGKSIIHDPLFEGRLEYLKQLEAMGAQINIIDDHRAEIQGPTKLKGRILEGRDIRGAMSFIIAGLVADGETILKNAYQVDRGYENIEKRLQGIGASIQRL